jgi:hypothetical protein
VLGDEAGHGRQVTPSMPGIVTRTTTAEVIVIRGTTSSAIAARTSTGRSSGMRSRQGV